MIDLLLHVNVPVMLITLILLMCLGSFLKLLLNFIENLLQLVKILTLPSLQFRVVPLRELRRIPIIVAA